MYQQQLRCMKSVLVAAFVLLGLLAVLPWSAATPAAAAAEGTARLRAVHAIPDVGPVDLYINEKLTLSNVPFFTVSGYLSIPSGKYRIAVVPAGQTLRDVVLWVNLDLEGGKDYTLAVRTNEAATKIRSTLLNDDNSAPEAGKAKIRAAHYSRNAPPVDIYVNGSKVISDLSYRRASEYLTVDPGTYTLGIAPAGGDIIFTAEATLTAGQVVTAWANGLLGGSGDQAFKITPSIDSTPQATARVRAVHAVPDIAGSPVDVYANGTKLVTFDFFTATDYLTVPVGQYDIRVVLAGGNPQTEAVIQQVVSVEGGKDYSLIARGTDGHFGLSAREDDNSAPPAGKAKIRAAHFSPDAPSVDIYVNGNKVISKLKYREVSGYLTVDPGTYTIGIAPAGGEIIYTVDATVGADLVVTAWANGLLGGSGNKAFKVTPTVDASF